MRRFRLLLCPVMLLAACGNEQSAQNNNASRQEPIVAEGKAVFISNCIQCHSLHEDKIGPKLEGVMARWNNDTARIRAFIRNSQGAINSGDPRAVAVLRNGGKH